MSKIRLYKPYTSINRHNPHFEPYPLKLEGKFEVKMSVDDVEKTKVLDHGYPPKSNESEFHLQVDGHTCVNLIDPTDDTIHSPSHFIECIDRAFADLSDEYKRDGLPWACANHRDFFRPWLELGAHVEKEPIRKVYLNDWVVEQLGYDKSKLLRCDNGWYMVRNARFPKFLDTASSVMRYVK